jgi:hypothetical protein
MEAMRESWTDERLDDLKDDVGNLARRVDAGFAEGRAELRHEAGSIRDEMKEEFRAVNARFDAMQGRFDAMQGGFNALQRTIIQIGGGMAAAFCAALIGLIATQI